jgi:hypothetical protein
LTLAVTIAAVLGWALLGLVLWRDRGVAAALVAAEAERDAAVSAYARAGAAYREDVASLSALVTEKDTRLGAIRQEVVACLADQPGGLAGRVNRLLGAGTTETGG